MRKRLALSESSVVLPDFYKKGNKMKKIKKEGIKALLLIVLIICLCVLEGCKVNYPQNYLSEELKNDCTSASLSKEVDTHSGFHGDGISFYVLEFENEDFLNEIMKDSRWNKLPLSENLTAILYGNAYDTTKADVKVVGPYVTGGENDQPLFPVVENGYYYFEDRQDESGNPQDDSKVLDRESMNFTIAIYDLDSRILYFCEYDS